MDIVKSSSLTYKMHLVNVDKHSRIVQSLKHNQGVVPSCAG